MTQDGDGRIYAAVPDDSAIYCYDGVNWDRIPTPSSPLTIQSDARGQVFVGLDDGIVRLKRDVAGQPSFVNLAIPFEPSDSHSISISLKGIDEAGNGVVFANGRLMIDVQSKDHLLTRAGIDERFVGRVHDRNYVRSRSETGAFVIEDGERVPVRGLESTDVCSIVESSEHEMMVLTSQQILVLDDGQLSTFSAELNAALPENSSICLCCPNSDGTVSIGTTAGFFCCATDGRLLYRIGTEHGLESPIVTSSFQDANGDLWLATEVGLACIGHAQRNDVMSFVNSERNVTDMLYAYDNSVLVGRRSAPYRLDVATMEATTLPELNGTVMIDAEEFEGNLLVATADGVELVEGNSVHRVFEANATAFAMRKNTSLAAVAVMECVVELADVRSHDSWLRIQSIPVRSEIGRMEVAGNGDIVGLSYDGTMVTRIQFEDDWHSTPVVSYFRTPPAQLLRNGHFVLLVSTDGWLDYDPEVKRGFPFVTASCLEGIQFHDAELATFTTDDDLVVAGARRIHRYTFDRDSGEYLARFDLNAVICDDMSCEPIELDGWFFAAHARGLTVFREDNPPIVRPACPVISLASNELRSDGAVSAVDSQSSVRFRFGVPVYCSERMYEFQCRLLPSQKEWSEWSESGIKEFTNLEPGRNQFQVRARMRGQSFTSASILDLDVVPKWYETNTARFMGFLCMLGIIGGVMAWREKKAVIANQELEALVARRTSLLKDANGLLKEQVRLAAESERARSELAERYQESERLESLGAMAGGIAHDFNNLLAVIVMQTELLKMRSEGADVDSDNSISVIESTADTAAQLCRQMLAASSSSPLENKQITLHELVQELHPLLRSSVTPYPLDVHLDLGAGCFVGDASQIKQIILNLVVNAREAQSQGQDQSAIVIETGQRQLTDRQAGGLKCIGDSPASGEFAWICVADHGPGMDDETKRRMFDPFYSTKEPGRGLGMATVLQTVSRHGGGIVPKRHENVTRMAVYLPISRLQMSDSSEACRSDVLFAGDQPKRVLLVDDEPSVLESAAIILEGRGFRVFPASSGEDGLKLFQEDPNEIDLAILDISLPGINGQELATELLKDAPGLPIVMMSGFSEAVISDDFVSSPSVTFLKKPFRSHGLFAACSTVSRAFHR